MIEDNGKKMKNKYVARTGIVDAINIVEGAAEATQAEEVERQKKQIEGWIKRHQLDPSGKMM